MREVEGLTMCLAAKMPSTIAQQNEATTPKLIKTIEATSCNTDKNLLYSFKPQYLHGLKEKNLVF